MTFLILRAILRRFTPYKRRQILAGLSFIVGGFGYLQLDLFQHKAGLLMWFIPFRIHPDATYNVLIWPSLILIGGGALTFLYNFWYEDILITHCEADKARRERREARTAAQASS